MSTDTTIVSTPGTAARHDDRDNRADRADRADQLDVDVLIAGAAPPAFCWPTSCGWPGSAPWWSSG